MSAVGRMIPRDFMAHKCAIHGATIGKIASPPIPEFRHVKPEHLRTNGLAIAAAAQRTRCAIAHSDRPRPEAIPEPGGSALAVPVASRLTPARCSAKIVACHSRGPGGPVGVVLVRTGQNRAQNHQSIEIATLFVRFWRFSPVSSRVRRARLRVCACACMREDLARTTEPLYNIHVLQWDSGSRAVLERFWSEPAGLRGREIGGFARFSHILAGGYRRLVQLDRAGLACSTVEGAAAGETFGSGGGGVGRAGALGGAIEGGLVLALGGIWLADGNGGFLRVSGGGWVPVGRAMLEGWAQWRGNPCVSGTVHKPVRLARGGVAGAAAALGGDQGRPGDRAEAPPCAPISGRPLPVHGGAVASRNLDRLGPDTIPAGPRSGAGRRQTLNRRIGSGLDRALGAGAAPGRGWGWSRLARPGGLGSGARTADASGEMARVN